MRYYNLAMLCAAGAFLAVPALAQPAGSVAGGASTAHQHSGPSGMNPRQALMQDLQKAGFTDIRIQPESFVVHAKNSQGEPMLMRIGPDSMETVTEIPASGNKGESQQAMQGKSSTMKP